MTQAQKITELKYILSTMDGVIFRLCYNLPDYAQSERRDYKPFEKIINMFERWETS